MSLRSGSGMFGAYKRAPLSAKPAISSVPSNTVLCVDDSAVVRSFVRQALGKGGIEVLEAVNAAEANKVLHETPVRLVLVDWNMPGVDGGELVRKLRLIPGMREAKVVFITAEATPERIEAADEIGYDAFLAKPFTAEHLLEVVQDLLKPKPET